MTLRGAAFFVAALAIGFATPAVGGEVRGILRTPPRPSSTPGASLYDKYGGAKKSEKKDAGIEAVHAVVFLRPRAGVPPRPDRPVPVMDQSGIRFVPRVVPVQAGGQVRFTNSDAVFHNVFSLSPTKKFDLGRHPKGDSRIVTFPVPGVVQVFCDIHAEMVGFVVVVESPYYAAVDPEGNYRIADVPAGSYDAAAWAEGMTAFGNLGRVEVPAAGSVELSGGLPGRD